MRGCCARGSRTCRRLARPPPRRRGEPGTVFTAAHPSVPLAERWSSSAVAVRAGLSMVSITVFAAEREATMPRGAAGVLYVVPLVA